MQDSIRALQAIDRSNLLAGSLGGLLFADSARFIDDLPPQLAMNVALVGLARALALDHDPRPPLAQFREALGSWMGRHGFGDRSYCQFRSQALKLLREAAQRLPDGAALLRPADDHETGDFHGAWARVLEGLRSLRLN